MFLVQTHMHEQSSAMETNTTNAGSESTSRMPALSTACDTSQVALLNAHDVNNVNICFYSSNDDVFLLIS